MGNSFIEKKTKPSKVNNSRCIYALHLEIAEIEPLTSDNNYPTEALNH